MGVKYNKLWKLLIDKGIKKMEFKDMVGIGTSTLAKLGNNRSVSMDVLMKICKTLECDIGDIVEFTKDAPDN